MIDVSLVLVIVGSALYGWTAGWRPMGARAFALAAGYLAAILLTRPVGGLLARATDLPVLAAFALGGLLAFVAGAGVAHAVGRRWAREAGAPSTGSRAGGVALGAASGVALVVVLGWAVGALGGLTGALPHAREGVVVRSSAEVVRVVTAAAGQRFSGDPFLASATASVVSDPVGAMEAARTIMEDERFEEVFEDQGREIFEAMRAGDPGPLAGRPGMAALARDPEFMEAARTVGLVPRGGEVDALGLARAFTDQIGPAIRTLEALRSDAEFQRMLDEADVAEAYAEGDIRAFLANDDFMELADRVRAELKRQQIR